MGYIRDSRNFNAPYYDLAVVGGGWAGLSAAIYAAKQGQKVALLEAAPQLGGRARTVWHQDEPFDNGQHMIIGAYDTFFELLDVLQLDKQDLFSRTPFFYEMHDEKKAPRIPFYHHRMGHFSKTLVRYLPDLTKTLWHVVCRNAPLKNESVLVYLTRLKISAKLIETFLAPLTLASMTTAIDMADAQHFVTILKRLMKRGATDYYFPKQNLSRLFCEPAAAYLKQHQTDIFLHQRILRIEKNDAVFTLKSKNDTFTAKRVIVAVHPAQLPMLLDSFDALSNLRADLTLDSYQTISTLYFDYHKTVHLPSPMLGILNGPVDWVMEGGFMNQKNRIIGVISDHKLNASENRVAATQAFLHEHFHFPKVAKTHFMISEKRAAFACTALFCAKRPSTRTPVAGLLLAGDFIDTGLPATLEGAVLSGKMAAHAE